MTSEAIRSQITDYVMDYYLLNSSVFKLLIKSTNMPMTLFKILKTLSEHRSLRMGEMSNILGISRPNLTPNVEKLVTLNYVERKSDKRDRRVADIAITDKGLEALNSEKKIINENLSVFFKKIPHEKQDRLINAIAVINESLAKSY